MSPDARLLRADTDDDLRMWLSAWGACGHEPFAHPTYVGLFARSPGESACAIVTEAQGIVVLLPLILRAIPADLLNGGEALYDATSPYGYGGPYSSGPMPHSAWRHLIERVRDETLVSAFIRLALDAEGPAGEQHVRTVTTGRNVVVALTRSEREQWQCYDRKVRKNVNRARRSGLQVSIRPRFTDLSEFVSLYHRTMARRSATDFYLFDQSFFETLQTRLTGNHLAVEVRDESGRLVSAEVVLTSDRSLYSFLGGTLEEAFPSRPNDLLKHEVIRHGRDTMRDGFVLGGGYSVDDGIFRYKRAFDPEGEVDYRTVRIVADPNRYTELTAGGVATPHLGDSTHDYFPAYRAPATDHPPPGFKDE